MHILLENVVCFLLKLQQVRRGEESELDCRIFREELVGPGRAVRIVLLVLLVLEERLTLECIHLDVFWLVSAVAHQILEFFVFNEFEN